MMMQKYLRATIQFLLSRHKLFLASLKVDYSKKNGYLFAAIFIVVLVAFANLITKALINGDMAVYAEQIKTLNFSIRTTHIGFYPLGALFYMTMHPFLGDYTFNTMSIIFGAGTTALIYLMGFTLTGKHTTGVVSSLFIATNFMFILHSVYSEVYIVQAFFIILAIQCWLLNRPIISGISIAIAFLVTPSTVFALIMFPLLQPEIKKIRDFLFVFIVITCPVILFHFNDYFFGARSIMNIQNHLSLTMSSALIKEGHELIYGMVLTIPFLLFGIIEIIKQKKWHLFGLFIFSLWFISLIIGERFRDVPVQLPTYILLGLVAGLGFEAFQLSTTKRKIRNIILLLFPILIVAVNSTSALAQISSINREIIFYRNIVLQADQSSQSNYTLVGTWERIMLFKYYTSRDDIDGIVVDNFPKTTGWQTAKELWILGHYPRVFRTLENTGYKIMRFKSKDARIYQVKKKR